MATRSREYIEGFEFDWLACDADGHVALFSTAGGGYAPEEFLEDVEAHERAIGLVLSEGPGGEDTWSRCGERGLFAYDSDYLGSPYRRIAAPERALRLEELPPQVVDVVRRVVFNGLRFSEENELSGELLKASRC